MSRNACVIYDSIKEQVSREFSGECSAGDISDSDVKGIKDASPVCSI